jgi:iron complex outermembrane receptor protein
MRIRGDARALASYALQRAVDQQTEQRLPNSPEHVAKARISLPWPTSRSSLAFEGQYLSRRTTLSGGSVAEATTLNIHLVHPLGRSWKLVAGVRNLFDSEYLDPVSGQHLQDAVAQNGRTFRIGANWKFWAP